MTLRQRAHAAHRNGHTEIAKELYKKLLKGNCIPEDIGNLGSIYTAENLLNEAIALYERYLVKWPNNYQLTFNASNTYIKLGKLEKAIEMLEEAIKIKSDDFNSTKKLIDLLSHRGETKKSIRILENYCMQNKTQGLAWLELGILYYKFQLYEKALQAFEYGNQCLPNHSRLIANKLTLLKDLNKFQKAKDFYDALTSDQRNNVNVQGSWAGLLLKNGNPAKSIEILEKVIEIQPNISTHWINLAAAKKALKHNLDCQRDLKKGLKYNPNNYELKQSLAQSFSESGKAIQAVKLLDIESQDWSKSSEKYIFNTQFIGASTQLISSEKLSEIARSWEQQKLNLGISQLWKDTIRNKINNRKIKIAYLSADFNNHPVSRFLLPLLKTHDKSITEITCISCGSHKDKVSDLISNNCDRWLNVAGVEDMEIARVISDLAIDVLIELGGFTGHSRLSLLIYKPAPIQLSYLGYFAPTYLSSIDGWIGDEELFGGLNSIDKKENLIKIDQGYMAFQPLKLPKIKQSYSELIRFGCFNNSRKLTPETIIFFSSLINNIPNTQLVIKSITFIENEEKARIYHLFIQAGVNENQLRLLDWIEGTEAHLDMYQFVDIALDTFPYGGATTTAEALWMGVPVISLAGTGMIGRLSSSILRSANCKEWIAKDLNHYNAIAKELASKGRRSIQSREELRAKVSSSPLANGRRVSSQLETIAKNQLNNLGII